MNQMNTPIKNIRGNSSGTIPQSSYSGGAKQNNSDSQNTIQQQYQNFVAVPQQQIQQQYQQRGPSISIHNNQNVPFYNPTIQSQIPSQSYLFQNNKQQQGPFQSISPAKIRNTSCETGKNNLTPTKTKYVNCYYNPQVGMNTPNQATGAPNSNFQNATFIYSISSQQQKGNSLQHSNSKGNSIGYVKLASNNSNANNNSGNNIQNTSGYGAFLNNQSIINNNSSITAQSGIQQSPQPYNVKGGLSSLLTSVAPSKNYQGLMKPIHQKVILQSPTKENLNNKSLCQQKQSQQFHHNVLENSNINNQSQQQQQQINSGKKIGNHSIHQQSTQINTNSTLANNSIYAPSPQKIKAEKTEYNNASSQQLQNVNTSLNGPVLLGQVPQNQLSASKQKPQILQNSIVSKLATPNNYHIQSLHNKQLQIHQDQRLLLQQNNNLSILQNVSTPTIQSNFVNQKTLEANLKEALQEKGSLMQKLVKKDEDLQLMIDENCKLNEIIQQLISQQQQQDKEYFEKSQSIAEICLGNEYCQQQEKVKSNPNKFSQVFGRQKQNGEEENDEDKYSDRIDNDKLIEENKQLQEMVNILERRINQLIASKEEDSENGKKESNSVLNQDDIQFIQIENEDLRKKMSILIQTNEKNMDEYSEVITQQDNKLKLLAEENANLNQAVKNKLEEINQIHSKYQTEFQKIKSNDQSCKELDSLNKQLKQQFENLQNDYILVNKEKELLKNDKHELQNKINANKVIHENNKGIIEQFEQKISQIIEEKDMILQQFQEKQDQNNVLIEDQNELNLQIDKLNQLVHTYNNELQLSKEQNQQLSESAIELTRQLEILINENEKLNNYIQQQNKNQSDMQQLQNEIQDRDQKIEELVKHIEETQNQKNNEINEYETIITEQKDILKELEEKIHLLVQENDKLNQIVQNQQLTQNDFQFISEMEFKVQELAEENQKLLVNVEKYKQEAEMWKKQILQQSQISTSSSSIPPAPQVSQQNLSQQYYQQPGQLHQQQVKSFTDSSPSSSIIQTNQPNYQATGWQQHQQELNGSWYNQSAQFSNQSEQQLQSAQYLQQQCLQQQKQQQQPQQQGILQLGQIYPLPQGTLGQKRFPSAEKQNKFQ